jgi:hypothetical protein
VSRGGGKSPLCSDVDRISLAIGIMALLCGDVGWSSLAKMAFRLADEDRPDDENPEEPACELPIFINI